MVKSNFHLLAALLFLFFNSINSIAQTWQDYEKLMIENFKAGNNEKAIEYGEKAIGILKNSNPKGSDYGAVLNNLAYVYVEVKEFEKAEKAYLEVLEIITPVLGKEHRIYARTINYLGEIYLRTGLYDKSEQYLSEALLVRKRLLPATKSDCQTTYRFLKELHICKKNISKAISYMDSVLSIIKDLEGETSQAYFNEYLETATVLKKNGNVEKATGLIDFVLNKPQIKKARTDGDFNVWHKAVTFYRQTSQYKKAIASCISMIENRQSVSPKSIEMAYDIIFMGLLYYENGQFEKAMATYDKVTNLIKEIRKENTEIHALLLHNIAVLQYDYGNFIEAEQYYIRAIEIREKTLGKIHPDYVSTINGLATLYYEWGNFSKAEPLFLESLDILHALNNRNDIYFTILTNLGELYENMGHYSKAADYYNLAYKTGDNLFGKNSLDFARLENKIARFYKTIGQYKLSDSLYMECIKSIVNSVGKKHPFYPIAVNSRATLYLKTGDYHKAEKDLLESAEFNRNFYGDYHLRYAESQNNLAALYYLMKDKKKSEKSIINANEILINQINNYMAYLAGQESEAYLKSTDYLFDVYYSFYFLEKDRNPALPGYAYDNILARKSLMLQSEKQMRQSILKTRDASLIKEYNTYIELKDQLAKYYSINNVKDSSNAEQIKVLIEKAEKKLTTNSEVFSLRNNLNSAGWDDIKKSLKKTEAAIEFIKFRFYNLSLTDSFYYCALIMRPEFKYPKMVFLFEERELSQLIDRSNFKTEEKYIYNLYHKTKRKEYGDKPDNDTLSVKIEHKIWLPLEEHLKGIETVFYSPAGLLNYISFAALSVNDSTYVSDKYKLHTLLSTRNLINYRRYTPIKEQNLSLYGGIEYDIEPEEISNLAKVYKKDTLSIPENQEIKNLTSTIKRGESWNFLQGTLEEINAIENLYSKKGIKINVYKGKNAIEETFKQYIGEAESPGIIHIATHGFFFPDSKSEKQNTPNQTENRNVFRMSHNPLVRSGLLFAGANHSWNCLEMPPNTEDGILTAYEVSNTNLNNTELVVLSACQTGLGEIKGSEGVYGLQRSFKIAGAEYIIMSLWQIPDFQTVELMKAFYTYKSLNLTIPEAFQQAQNEMKQKYQPFYWAAFVLIK